MRKLSLLLIAIIAITNSYSQEVYFLTGSNFTKYNFSSGQGSIATSLESGTGTTYEMGYTRPLKNNRFSHTFGVNLNEFNVVAGSLANSYTWNTKYLGINNSLDFTVPLSKNFKLFMKAGLNLSTIIYGKQSINGAIYDLKSQDEYSGLSFIPFTGVHLKYKINDFGYLSFGYGVSKSVILFNISQEKLTTSTNQILFGIHFNIKNTNKK
jgi:hypothetical protein